VAVTPKTLRAAVLVLTLGAVAVAGALYGVAAALIAFAAGALLLGIALLWGSVMSLTGETPLSLEEALTLGAPSAEEEQKRSLLRALKDLEFERSVGKITPEDYQELSARYRAEAIRLMQDLDERLLPARQRAEKLLAERLAREEEARAKAEPAADEPDESDDESDDESEPEPASQPEPSEREPVAATEPEVKS
jgi:hypothetical protein